MHCISVAKMRNKYNVSEKESKILIYCKSITVLKKKMDSVCCVERGKAHFQYSHFSAILEHTHTFEINGK